MAEGATAGGYVGVGMGVGVIGVGVGGTGVGVGVCVGVFVTIAASEAGVPHDESRIPATRRNVSTRSQGETRAVALVPLQ